MRRLLSSLLVLAVAGLATEPQPAEAGDALDEYFRGKVTALDEKTKTITLKYDFRKKDQIKDWRDEIPYRIQRRKDQKMSWYDTKIEIIGNSGARHKAEWMGDVMVTATFTPDMERDFGGYLQPVTLTEDFASFTFVETFFHAFDGSAGGLNSIIKFGAQWREGDSGDEFIGFRYVSRKPPKKAPAKGNPIRASFGIRKKKQFFFTLPEYELKGSDRGKKLKRFFVGFYAIKGRLFVDNVEITGRLSTDWMKREGVELRTAEPIGGGEEGIDEETQELMTKHKQGKRKPINGLLDILKDDGRSAAVHEAVVTCLSTGPKRAVLNVRDLLYSPVEKVREFGIRIIKTQLGKDYGYRPGSSEKSRSKAVQKLNDDLKKNPGLLEG